MKSKQQNAQPNILFITSDQHRPDCYGFTGERNIKTPHLDALAAGGTRFDCAITANVLCQPVRASILTGMLPLTHGVYDNQVNLDPAIGEQGWAGQLSKNGYRSKYIGKAHFGHDERATNGVAQKVARHQLTSPKIGMDLTWGLVTLS